MTTSLEQHRTALEKHCRHYREDGRLAVAIDTATGRILLQVGTRYGAVTMPSDLGERVQHRLHLVGLAGPVLAHPRAHRWTFLTGPTRLEELTATAAAQLFRLYTTVAGTGSQIVLPSADDERSGYRVWIAEPDGDHRPPQRAVLDAVRELGRAKHSG